MRKVIFMVVPVFFALVFLGGLIHAQEITIGENGEIIQKTPDGDINWSKGVISAVGYASADQDAYSQRVAAAASARANLLTVLGDLTIKRGITVQHGKVTGDINIQRIEGVLRGSFIGAPKRQQDGTVAITAYKTLTPEILNELLPTKYFKGEGTEARFEPGAPSKETALAPSKAPARPYTGLIVDAKGLGVIPSLGFRVLVKDSNEVLYGLSSADRVKVIDSRGMASYAASVEAGRNNPRAGDNPLVVKATGASGERHTDIFISKEDAASIYKANLENSFLKDLKVVVVCGG